LGLDEGGAKMTAERGNWLHGVVVLAEIREYCWGKVKTHLHSVVDVRCEVTRTSVHVSGKEAWHVIIDLRQTRGVIGPLLVSVR